MLPIRRLLMINLALTAAVRAPGLASLPAHGVGPHTHPADFHTLVEGGIVVMVRRPCL
jgi:hypothetical protein